MQQYYSLNHDVSSVSKCFGCMYLYLFKNVKFLKDQWEYSGKVQGISVDPLYISHVISTGKCSRSGQDL